MKVNSFIVWNDLQTIRKVSPLIHNITNYVVMQQTANSLLALGASPVMTQSVQEVREMSAVSKAIVLNMGTLDSSWEQNAWLALQTAKLKSVPLVFDPVGVGATAYRNEAASAFVNHGSVTVIRGNASEIVALSGKQGNTKGVESSHLSIHCTEEACHLSQKTNSIVVMSGQADFITDGKSSLLIHNGHPLMRYVTGMGCSATAIIGAFLAVNQNALLASIHAMIVMGITGELAAERAAGPGSFKTAFIDALYTLSLEEIEQRLRVESL